MKATSFMFESANERNIGRIVWNWHGYDSGGDLTSNQEVFGGGEGIDSCVQPTNLTPLGQLVWDDNRS